MEMRHRSVDEGSHPNKVGKDFGIVSARVGIHLANHEERDNRGARHDPDADGAADDVKAAMLHKILLRSAKQNEPKDAGEKKRKAWIDNNGPEDLLVECQSDKDAVANHRKDDAREKAYKPRREERTENVEGGRTSAACDFDRQECIRQNRPALQAAHRFTSLLLSRFALMAWDSSAEFG